MYFNCTLNAALWLAEGLKNGWWPICQTCFICQPVCLHFTNFACSWLWYLASELVYFTVTSFKITFTRWVFCLVQDKQDAFFISRKIACILCEFSFIFFLLFWVVSRIETAAGDSAIPRFLRFLDISWDILIRLQCKIPIEVNSIFWKTLFVF